MWLSVNRISWKESLSSRPISLPLIPTHTRNRPSQSKPQFQWLKSNSSLVNRWFSKAGGKYKWIKIYEIIMRCCSYLFGVRNLTSFFMFWWTRKTLPHPSGGGGLDPTMRPEEVAEKIEAMQWVVSTSDGTSTATMHYHNGKQGIQVMHSLSSVSHPQWSRPSRRKGANDVIRIHDCCMIQPTRVLAMRQKSDLTADFRAAGRNQNIKPIQMNMSIIVTEEKQT